MLPGPARPSFRRVRREFLGLSLVALAGCTSPLIRGQSPAVEDVAADEANSLPLVGDYCGGWGLNYKKVEAIGLVTNLDNTGSDPPPGQAREYILGDMRARDVKDPEKLLTSPRVSLVQITALLPPNCQKGDAIDVFVGVPKKSATTSLRGGWLMQARLRQLGVFNNKLTKGAESGLAEGHITVDSIFNGSADKLDEVRGRILGGGVSGETRHLGLRILRDDVSIETTSVISAAVNQRFHTFDRGSKKGVAEPKNATFVKLLVPARYKHNLTRYVDVVRAVPLRETPLDRARRLETLEQKLLEPTTASKAAIQLEAIGKEAIPSLKKGLTAPDPEIRFHAAAALAYLDEPQSAKTLGESARSESAFRWEALTALQSIDHVHAYEALSELLHVESAETRYGAFRALRRRNPNDPAVRGESLGSQMWLHLIPSPGEPMIHVSKSDRCEIVLFGQNIPVAPPQGLYAGKYILITSTDPEQIKLSRFAPGEQDRFSYAGPTVEQLIRGIVSLGGSYGDVIQCLHDAKKNGLISARIAVDAIPKSGRTYYRDDAGAEENSELDAKFEQLLSDSPNESPSKRPDEDMETPTGPEEDDDLSPTYVDPRFTPATKNGVWGTVKGWFTWTK